MNTEPNNTTTDQPLLFGPAPGEAQGELATLYRDTERLFGFLPNAARLFGISPHLLAQQMEHVGFFSTHPTLSAPLLAFIRLLVSEQARCTYCIDLNVALLMQAGVAAEAIGAARRDPDQAPLPEAEKALLHFVLAAVANPHPIGEQEMARLRAHGWRDSAIFEAVHHGAHAVAVDIILDTFKVTSD